MVSKGWFRFFDEVVDESVIAMGKRVSALIAIKRGREASDENALSYASLMPIGFARENLYVLFPEMVVGVCSVLHYGRFVDARRRLGG